MKEYKELTLLDNYMFCKVLSNNPELCREFIEVIIGRKIARVQVPDYEKTIVIDPWGKTVRLDLCLSDDEGTVYNLEMQTTRERNLPKRCRYYQGMMDMDYLESGDQYSKLPPTIMVFICSFDFYHMGKPKYIFQRMCVNGEAEFAMGDETEHIIVNLEGDYSSLDSSSRVLYDYLKSNKPGDSFTERLEREVSLAKARSEWESEYMQWRTIEMDHAQDLEIALEKGLEQGRSEGLEQGRSEGLEQGRSEGADLLAVAIRQLREGKTREDLLGAEIPENIVETAMELI